MTINHQKLIVFAAPSIRGLENLLTSAEIRPPVQRGDLDALREQYTPGWALIADGLFGASMAVTLTECRLLLEAGWELYGCSSMGALRAAELYRVGMQGLGRIYDLMRAGVILDDAEVAVAYHPQGFVELTISLVHLRFVLANSELNETRINTCWCAAKDIYFLERSLAALRQHWLTSGVDEATIEQLSQALQDPEQHPKLQDARYALKVLSGKWQTSTKTGAPCNNHW
jgi:hypothetical protein